MTILIIIVAICLFLIILGSKKKANNTTSTETKPILPKTESTNQKFTSKVSSHIFPDRVETIVWHINAIDKSLSNGDLNLANLSYAKLIESIRQQNINEPGVYESNLKAIQDEYKEFRSFYKMEYPKEFLPPSERKKDEVPNDTPVYLQTLNFEDLPKSIIKHIDIVRTVTQWNELGFKPKKKNEYGGRWNDIKRQDRYFDFVQASLTNSSHKLSLETGKRITTNPYYIKALVEQGIPIGEFIHNTNDLTNFISANDLFDNEEYEEALKQIDLALSIKQTKEYRELKKEIQIKLGDENTVIQKFKENENDIDSPIHTGEIYDWFKALLKTKKFGLVLNFIVKTNEGLDKLSTGIIKPKIYGKQSSDWYLGKKEDFTNNLYRIFEKDLSSIDQTDEAIQMFELFVNVYTGKEIKPIESIADLYANWNLKDKAKQLYKTCLDKLINEEKPRVKARLNKKIEDLNIE